MESESAARPVVAIVGPTAAGKSELSLRLAAALDGEVVNADSMQLYRGMDIGTGKLAPAERGGVPHHLLDVWDVTETASVVRVPAHWPGSSSTTSGGAGRTAILVGGSGLYVRAAIDDLEFPGTDPALRARLEEELAGVGPAVLHARLAAARPGGRDRDPAQQRAPDRARAGGRSSCPDGRSARRCPSYRSVLPAVQIGLELPRSELDQRIAARVRPDVAGAGSSTRYAGAGRAGDRAASGPDGQPGTRVRAGAPLPRRRLDAGRGGGPDRALDAAIRSPAGILVPAGPENPLAACGPAGADAAGMCGHRGVCCGG